MHEPLETQDPAPAEQSAALPCSCPCTQPRNEADAADAKAATYLGVYYDINGEPAPDEVG